MPGARPACCSWSLDLAAESIVAEWTAQTALISGRSRSARTPKLGGCATPRDFNVTTSRSRSPPTRPPWPKRWRIANAPKGLTVVFSTYQSLPAVADAQGLGVDDFDLVICDEAHRTTGFTWPGEDDSNFVRIHDNTYHGPHAGCT